MNKGTDMVDNERRRLILRFAQLYIIKQRLEKEGKRVPKEVLDEMQSTRLVLHMSDEKIMESAAQNTVDPGNHST